MRAARLLVVGTLALLGCAKGADATGYVDPGATGGGGGASPDSGEDASEDAPPISDVSVDPTVDSLGSDGPVPADAGQEADANPCVGVVCSSPPPNECADADNLTVYSANGTCTDGDCSYPSQVTPCAAGCAAGACVDDPCLGVSCNSPPAKQCSDQTHLTVYESPGTCDAGTCSYTSHLEYCSFGCANDACSGNPCQGVSCVSPPASYCSDSAHLVTYGAAGTCTNGACSYSDQEQFCAYGCANASCAGDPCSGVTCASPPASYCVNTSTLKKYGATGTCAGGNCQYDSNDTTCPHGCVNGACNDCSIDTECSTGRWCSAGTCVACNSDLHCGTSCTNCTAAGQVCEGGASCGCPGGTKLCQGSCVALNLPQWGCADASCTACPQPAYATGTTCGGVGGTCAFTCDASLHRIPQGGACVCDAAGHFEDVGGTCQCASGYILQGNACISACAGTQANGFCYWYVSTAVTFDVAEADCVTNGGHLASIGSQAENDTVRAAAQANAWIGLRDLGTSHTASSAGDDCTDAPTIDPAGGSYADSTSPLWDDVGPCSKSTNGAEDMFFFLNVSQQGLWVFTVPDSSFDPYIGLWVKGGSAGYTGCLQTFVACDDDSGPSYSSRLIRLLDPATYVVVVDGSGSYEYGSFTLHARRFTFTDGSPHLWQTWNTDEPNNSGSNEKCTELLTASGNWNDLSCSSTHPYVCKKPL